MQRLCLKSVEFLGDYIGGQFVIPKNPDGQWQTLSPGDLADVVVDIKFQYDHIEQACKAAKNAFVHWSRRPLEQRMAYLTRLKEIYLARADEMAQVIARETGKPLWEAKTEATALASKIDITLSQGLDLVKTQTIKNALPGVDGLIHFKPKGPMAVVGPFNFPAHLPNGHIVPALATGNTVVFKPSDKTPATAQMMAEFFHQAEFPPGVFNLLQGPGEMGRRLILREEMEGILFTGSYDVGLKIKQETMTHFWKILVLEMGGKNASIVWHDADMEKSIYECLLGAYLTAGQRCSSTSRILVHRSVAADFVDRFYEASKKIKVGHWSDDVFMGPLISSDSVEKYIRFQEIAKREGCESIMRGKALKISEEGYYVTPSICKVSVPNAESVYQKSEIFGPNVAIYEVDDFDGALKIVNSSSYGLAVSVFTKDEALVRDAIYGARVGIVNWNRTTNGASSLLPFGGMGKSGNDRPSASFAVHYCTVPVASLHDKTGFDPDKILPGLRLEAD